LFCESSQATWTRHENDAAELEEGVIIMISMTSRKTAYRNRFELMKTCLLERHPVRER
jgi:hypothetical protein